MNNGSRPRPARLLLPHTYYHVMTRGNNRNIVFRSVNDYQYFLGLVARYKAEQPFDLYHYCLMPSHTHWQIRTSLAADFVLFMKRLNWAYFHYYRRQYGWIGHVWQDRYKSQPIGKDAYFTQCGKYIELNPVRAGLTKKPEDYRYSSYRYYAQGATDNLITPDLFYEGLGKTMTKRQKVYQKLVVDEMVMTSYKQPVWGSLTQRHNEREKLRYHLKQA